MIEIYTFISLFFTVLSNWEAINNEIKIIQEKIQEEKIIHIETPEQVKSLYFTSTAIKNKKKKENLINLVKNTEVNSVTIDIKTVSGYINFEMPEKNFWDIKPVSNGSIQDPKKLLKELHKEDIYIIGRVVVFKDKSLAERRVDLAIKRWNKKDIWSDYNWKKYVDPGSQEVWNYNANIAKTAFEMWFDEINFDYVRFPTDGKVHDTYYPFSHKIRSDNPKWGNIIVIDKFSNHITSKLKKEVPELTLSADVFWLITNSDLFQIGQNLESFLLYFDYVWPMIYPSHYWEGFLWYKQPDNNPYEIFTYALDSANKKIDQLNIEIHTAKTENRKINIKWKFNTAWETLSIKKVNKIKLRPWLQGFSCSRCKWAIPYTRNKFRKQIQAIEDAGLNSWWVWSSGSYYYPDWYNDKYIAQK